MEGQSTNIRTEVDRELRERAVERLRKKSEFRAHLLSYVLVNGFLVIIWAITGASFFWPVFHRRLGHRSHVPRVGCLP
jgi:hypothetical protein